MFGFAVVASVAFFLCQFGGVACSPPTACSGATFVDKVTTTNHIRMSVSRLCPAAHDEADHVIELNMIKAFLNSDATAKTVFSCDTIRYLNTAANIMCLEDEVHTIKTSIVKKLQAGQISSCTTAVRHVLRDIADTFEAGILDTSEMDEDSRIHTDLKNMYTWWRRIVSSVC